MILTLWNETLGEVKTKVKRETHQIWRAKLSIQDMIQQGALVGSRAEDDTVKSCLARIT